MKYPCFFIVFTLFFACNQATDKVQNHSKKAPEKPIFLIYGELSPIGYLEERDSSITQKFGFRVQRLTGCQVTPELVDSVAVINKKNNLLMESKYGKNWIQKFEKETNLKIYLPDIK